MAKLLLPAAFLALLALSVVACGGEQAAPAVNTPDPATMTATAMPTPTAVPVPVETQPPPEAATPAPTAPPPTDVRQQTTAPAPVPPTAAPTTASAPSAATPAPTATATPNLTPTPTLEKGLQTPVPTAMPTLQSTATPMPEPTPAVAPTPTPTPAPEPTATPTPTPVILTDTAGVREFQDPDVPYLRWEVGPEVPDSYFYNLREGVIVTRQYLTSLGLSELEGQVSFYLYWDIVPAMARVYGLSEEDIRRRFEGIGHFGSEVLIREGSSVVFKDISELAGSPSSTALAHSGAHSLSHSYQHLLPEEGRWQHDHMTLEDHHVGPAWLIEGGAEFQSLRAMAKGAVIRYDQRRQQYGARAGTVEAPLQNLETYDVLLPTPHSYSLGTMAVELLASHAGEETVVSYWTLLGSETTWREAFETAFGLTIDEFYPLFEEHRAAGFPEVDLPPLGPSLEELSQADRPALVALYNDTGGASWANNTNWLSGEHIGLWQGVTINVSGRVTELYLPENRLIGNLPPELGSLTELRTLILWANELSGPIPSDMASLTKLQELGLGGNRLSGEIPAWLGSLSNLRSLHLVNNRFTGQIPPEIGDLPLRGLFLLDNRLTGDIPAELGNLSDLQSLWLRDNNLTGCIPAELREVPDNDFAETGLPFCE